MQFRSFNKIPRLNKECTITEKIDGSNVVVVVLDNKWINEYKYNGCPDSVCSPCYADRNEEVFRFISDYCLYEKDGTYVFAGSRQRWLKPGKQNDNFGFAGWVQTNAEQLINLGVGYHYGEWYGNGIQRRYGLDHKRFALFNTYKWTDNPDKPECCDVVPVLYKGTFDTEVVKVYLKSLIYEGSRMVKGFRKPEGLIVYHSAAKQYFKVLIENDDKPKNLV